ncbi:MAG: ATP-binding cassette domain-containing protein, partial [Coriobacteriaceae bacterium]|nr:ATP-binding cassette domain-containing protein [Coriobacteriaceae bacterium]
MNALTISDFTFSYPEKDPLFTDVSLTLEEGSFALLVGRTGCGKTTLLRAIKSELAPAGNRRGLIEVFGRNTFTLTTYESASMIGHVAQSAENQIVCDSVWHELAFGLENLGVSQAEMRRRIAEVASFFDIESLMHAPVTSLSGGQKQAVTLASILVMQPKLLLLDEPTAQLDPVAEKNFLHALFRINRELGITVVVATHAPETMRAYAHEAFCITDKRLEPISLDEFDFSDFVFDEQGHGERNHDERGYDEPNHGERNHGERKKKALAELSENNTALSLHDVFFRYTAHEPWVLRGLDVDIASGSIHAIIGANGSGKSTLLHLIAGILKRGRGQVKNKLSAAQALL